eukprot:CAMPEP_0172759126 /NCGR_PEP_ID=MMETSP1074-20121228/167121_1 /TAXON_ID=2916 /ORGANISM="Ceratium fusus, Strain PA161109" /LENGTH=458 /DNA_ID=CAMNT_0013592855 /DNA_START=8 /DNA_END=1381 /DNA_ORIENTATION=+
MVDIQHAAHFSLIYDIVISLEYGGDFHAALNLLYDLRKDLRMRLPHIQEDGPRRQVLELQEAAIKRLRDLAFKISQTDKVVYAYKVVGGQIYIPCECEQGHHRHGLSGLEEDQCFRISHCLDHRRVSEVVGKSFFSIQIKKDSKLRYIDHVGDPDLRKNRTASCELNGLWSLSDGSTVTLCQRGKYLHLKMGFGMDRMAVKIHERLYFADHLFFYVNYGKQWPAYIYGQVNKEGTCIHWHGRHPGKVTIMQEWKQVQRETHDSAESSESPEKSSESDEEESSEAESHDPSTNLLAVPAHDKCFLPATLFQASSGVYLCAENLEIGQQVLGVTGSILTVTASHMYPPRKREVVELRTHDTPSLLVTADHRVVVQGHQALEEHLAGDLRLGMKVVCNDGKPRELTIAVTSQLETAVVALKFTPDEAVAVHMLPTHLILTKGQRKRAIRRSQKHRRRPSPS